MRFFSAIGNPSILHHSEKLRADDDDEKMEKILMASRSFLYKANALAVTVRKSPFFSMDNNEGMQCIAKVLIDIRRHLNTAQ